MPSTIQISATTKQMLDMLKEKKQIRTYDKLIEKLLGEKLRIPDSMFGVLKGKKLKWTKADRADFREL